MDTAALQRALPLCLLLAALPLQAYIPALPANQSAGAPAQGDTNWIIQLNWHPIGIFSDGITHQLRSDSANHSIFVRQPPQTKPNQAMPPSLTPPPPQQGVLLHFSEFNATNQPPAIVPWIAMINCDSNATLFSNQDDIFTMARDRGAAAAMLYSLTSHSCVVNPEYLQNFDKPLDVFSAANLQGARLIESQFSNVLGAGYWFQSGLLNSSAPTILEQIKSLGLSNLTDPPPPKPALPPNATLQAGPNNQSDQDSPPESSADLPRERRSIPLDEHPPGASKKLLARSSPSHDHASHLKLNMNTSRHPSGTDTNAAPVYLIATLANAEITGNLDQQKQDRNQSSNFQSAPGNSNNPNTGLAMIILYAITGCVSFMFLIVIVSGAIRAIRNPDRYGPRPGGRVDPQTGEEDPYAQPRQTRAAGLGKAILDTFPIVKFGRQQNDPKFDSEGSNGVSEDPKAIVNAARLGQENIMMRERDPVQPSSDPAVKDEAESEIEEETRSNASDASPWQLPASQVPLMSRSRLSINRPSVDPQKGQDSPNSDIRVDGHDTASDHGDSTRVVLPQPAEPNDDVAKTNDDDGPIGRDLVAVNNSITCPICVCDFEDDDDIRMLPCDARHQFHKECVDPWLLNESKFCPLCRWDLSTRKDGSKIETDAAVEAGSDPPSPAPSGRPMGEPPGPGPARPGSWASAGPSADARPLPPGGSPRTRTSTLLAIVPHVRTRRRDNGRFHKYLALIRRNKPPPPPSS
ncbi:hypothetical protein PtA15_7A531 [Puccinia triticina]|uniref:RING-type domain-containing protein n=1 Tax=Puccinia triticina TaxID=208348 RepID=A0ABY7CVQ8_9BASI|nr:uncharacterized protein PtA15_7A531 [Puccinia triticina]WAQ86802.1 hypothetical protein PtA15_7A531 [Puccinia triticina]